MDSLRLLAEHKRDHRQAEHDAGQHPGRAPEVRESKSGHWLSLGRSFGEILNHGCKSLRSDFHRAGERMIDFHNGQQPGKD